MIVNNIEEKMDFDSVYILENYCEISSTKKLKKTKILIYTDVMHFNALKVNITNSRLDNCS